MNDTDLTRARLRLARARVTVEALRERFAKAVSRWPAGTPGGKGGEFAPGEHGGGTGAAPASGPPDLSSWSKPVEPVAALMAQPTKVLQSEAPSSWKARYHLADLQGAVRSAARVAINRKETVFLFRMQGGWRIEFKGSPSFGGTRAVAYLDRDRGAPNFYSITPAREVYRHAWAKEPVAKANWSRWPAGAPGGKGGEFAPKQGSGGGGGQSGFNFGGLFGLGTKPAPSPYAKPHPKANDDGKPVTIDSPTRPSDKSTWHAGDKTATFVPGGPAPKSLLGTPMKSWEPPAGFDGWAKVPGQDPGLEGPPPIVPHGKTLGTGVIIQEPDGRVWLTKPTNEYGGYVHTFPKGTHETGLSMQANAIKEAYEETGLKVEITGVVGDFERDTSVARFYTARRVGGTPADMGWETQALRLAPAKALKSLLNRNVDREIADAIGKIAKAFNASQPRWPAGTPLAGQWMAVGSGGFAAPPQIGGGTSNPQYQKQAEALHAMAQAGDKAGLKAAVGKLQAKVDAAKAKPKQNSHDGWNGKLLQYGQHLDAASAAMPKAVASVDAINGPTKLSSLTQVGAKPGGSNPGAVYSDAAGAKWLVKGNKKLAEGAVTQAVSDDRAKNEVLAAHLITAAGHGAPEMKLVDLEGKHGGGLGVASKMVQGVEAFDPKNPHHLAAVQSSFAVHALLANYDVIGLSHDNVVIKDGKAINIDPGGALLFRAQGTPKVTFSDKPSEWHTLRDPGINPVAAGIFGKMTQAQMQASAQALKSLDDATITKLVNTYGPGDAAAKAKLTDQLIARRNNIYGLAGLDAAGNVLAPLVIPKAPHESPAAGPLPKLLQQVLDEKKQQTRAKPAASGSPTSSVAPAMPNFDAHKIATTNTNAPSHNGKVATIETLAKSGNAQAILALQFGTNSYAQKQVKLANSTLAALGSTEKVAVGQKKGQHPSLVGHVQAQQAAEALATMAEASSGKVHHVDAAKLTKPPSFANWNGPGKGLSSNAANNTANDAEVAHLHTLAATGGAKAVSAYQVKSPSKHVAQYKQDLLDNIDDQLNPPAPLKVLEHATGSLNDIAQHFQSKHKVGTAASAIKAHDKIGYYVALGVAKTQMPWSDGDKEPPGQWVSDGYTAFGSLSSAARAGILKQQASTGAFAAHFRAGNLDHVLQGSVTVGKAYEAWKKEASDIPAGTKFYRYLSMPQGVIQKLLAAEPGTVVTDLSPMATSHKNGGTAGFGSNKIEFIALPGTRAMRSFGSGKFQGEMETTFLPGQRFVIHKVRQRKNGAIKIKAFLLPT